MSLPNFGGRYLADLGSLKVELHFESLTQLTFTIRDGAGLTADGYSESVRTSMTEIRPGVFLTSWQELSGATVTHLEDFETGTLLSNATLPSGEFVQMSGTITALDAPPEPVEPPRSNTDIVLAAMNELFVQGDLSALDRYWQEPYVQHSPNMPNGLEALRQAVPGLVGFEWNPQRVAAQDDLVMTHSRVMGWGPEPLVIVDVFRLESGRIVEHWDVAQPEIAAASSINGNPMV